MGVLHEKQEKWKDSIGGCGSSVSFRRKRMFQTCVRRRQPSPEEVQ